MATPQRYHVGQNFHKNHSIDISISVFCKFCEKFENSKWSPFLARQKIFEKSGWQLCTDNLWVKNFVEITI